MTIRLSRIRLRGLALFVVVAGTVAALFVACEAGLGEQSAVAETEPLTLTLTAETEICETAGAFEVWGILLRVDEEDEDKVTEERVTDGWTGVGNAVVRWRVEGGLEPYRLEIDGETLSINDRAYGGPVGVARVGCADTTVGRRWGEYSHQRARYYEADPQVDSGWKTVRAVVTDANGNEAEATARFYVLLDLGGGTTGEIMKRGETYRILGVLMTAPDDYDARVGGRAERECAENDPDPRCGDTLIDFGLVSADAWIALYEDDGQVHSRRPEADGSGGPAGAAGDDLTAAVDSWVESLGMLPKAE